MKARIFERAIVSAGIVALLVLFLPSAAWAHRCGPQTLQVKIGNTVSYAITGSDVIEHQILDKGDPAVAKIDFHRVARFVPTFTQSGDSDKRRAYWSSKDT